MTTTQALKLIEGLSWSMREALTCSHRGRVWAPRMPTIEALISRGLADDFKHTPDGLAVRDELLRIRKEEAQNECTTPLHPPGYSAGYAAFMLGEGAPPEDPAKRENWDAGYASARAHAETEETEE